MNLLRLYRFYRIYRGYGYNRKTAFNIARSKTC